MRDCRRYSCLSVVVRLCSGVPCSCLDFYGLGSLSVLVMRQPRVPGRFTVSVGEGLLEVGSMSCFLDTSQEAGAWTHQQFHFCFRPWSSVPGRALLGASALDTAIPLGRFELGQSRSF